MTPEEILTQIKERFGDALTETEVKGAEVRLTTGAENGRPVCAFVREIGFEYLNCLSGADWTTHLEVVYNLSSLRHPHKAHLRVRVDRDHPVVRSVSDLWRAADWHERECFDLFGVQFDGHPDHPRILLPEDWVGYPCGRTARTSGWSHALTGMEERSPRQSGRGAPKAAKSDLKPAALQPRRRNANKTRQARPSGGFGGRGRTSDGH
jgi:NADH-quinone oxidoreductase subunit C